MNRTTESKSNAALHAASEEELACRVQTGCAASFAELAQRLQPRLLFVLCRRLRHEADAEDVAQQTLLRVYEKIHLYNSRKKFSPWLFTIALRLATDHQRGARLPTVSTGEPTTSLADPQPTPEQEAIDREHAQNLWTLAERLLNSDQWTALWLLYGEGQSVKEIARALRRTTVSVRVLLYRARKTLTPHLAQYLQDAEEDCQDYVVPIAPQVVRAET